MKSWSLDHTCIHGLNKANGVTVFPHAIAQGASWDRELVTRVSNATAIEARILSDQAYLHTKGASMGGALSCDGGPLANSAHDPRCASPPPPPPPRARNLPARPCCSPSRTDGWLSPRRDRGANQRDIRRRPVPHPNHRGGCNAWATEPCGRARRRARGRLLRHKTGHPPLHRLPWSLARYIWPGRCQGLQRDQPLARRLLLPHIRSPPPRPPSPHAVPLRAPHRAQRRAWRTVLTASSCLFVLARCVPEAFGRFRRRNHVRHVAAERCAKLREQAAAHHHAKAGMGFRCNRAVRLL